MRNTKNNRQTKDINQIKISLSSPEDMLEKSWGEVVKPETNPEAKDLKIEDIDVEESSDDQDSDDVSSVDDIVEIDREEV